MCRGYSDGRTKKGSARGAKRVVGQSATGIPVGIAEGMSPHPFETLRGFSLLISLAPRLLPSYAVALLLVAHGGMVQHKIEEVAEQEL